MDKGGLEHEISIRYRNQLDVPGFFQMLKDPTYCYKFYWLEALVRLISAGFEQMTFSDVVDEMITNAWYSVVEFRIHLSGSVNGKYRDALEQAVWTLKNISNLSSRASKLEIKNALRIHAEKVGAAKRQLVQMVPYRALAGFFTKTSSEMPPPWGAPNKFAAFTEWYNTNVVTLPYIFGAEPGLDRTLRIHPQWARMIQDNTVAIIGWIQFEKLRWLQNNNIDVPNLAYKLEPPDEGLRKLSGVRKLWKSVMERSHIRDVFKGDFVNEELYDIDHFIPWSFVMHDEIWNLMPMDSSLNSSKSNKLPLWEPFFSRFAENQFLLYQMIFREEKIGLLFKQCQKDNLRALWASNELYTPGKTKASFVERLEVGIKPLYESAKRQGYEIWHM